MVFVAGFVAVLAGLVTHASSSTIETRAAANVSNTKTSLTLIYQNNLNASDDKNHIGAIVLDATRLEDAATACASVNEKLLSRTTLEKYKADFVPALEYQGYADYSDAERGYHIENGTVSTDGRLIFSSASRRTLPVLCTQSNNDSRPGSAPSNGSSITVSSGGNTFTGYRNQKSFRFLGIRFADTPQRWKYSSLYSKKGQAIQATAYGPQCIQGSSGSEDCLFLNIQTPYIPKAGSKSKLRPVMFWIHGGGFTGGTGSESFSDGGNLASREDIVVVSINYRLSTLGFLAIPGTNITGNYGIQDQITALDWTIANIASFGGDPKRITIIGGSAGAGSVRALLGSPKAIGKFQGAVALSNLGGGVTLGLSDDYGTSYSSYKTISESYAVAGDQIFSAAACTSTSMQRQISCLEKVPAAQLQSFETVARYVVQDNNIVNTPTLILSTRNASTAHVPVIFGVTRDDGASFTSWPSTPVSNHSQGLQVALGINSTWASRIIASNLFPFTSTGNITLDSFNVSARITTDKMFRCIDQATVYAGTVSRAFSSAYFYQLDRTIGGYDPDNLGGPAVTPGYPNGNPNLPYFRLHGGDPPWVFGNLGTVRDQRDLGSVQLSVGFFAAFVRGGRPEIEGGYLGVRGYGSVSEGVRRSGGWREVSGRNGKGEIMVLDYPARRAGFVDVEQCSWLGYPLDYYLKGGI